MLFRFFILSLLTLVFSPASVSAQTPDWVWLPSNKSSDATQVRFFRKAFAVTEPVQKAELAVMGDDEVTAYINGKRLLSAPGWFEIGFKAQRADVTQELRQGTNVLAARVLDAGVSAGFIAKLEIQFKSGQRQIIVSDSSWLVFDEDKAGWEAVNFNTAGWKNAVSIGKHGIQPWGDIMDTHRATPAESLIVPDGFKAELLRSAQPGEGSWVCMTVDDKGRIIVSPQESPDKEGRLIRFTLTPEGRVSKTERIDLPIGSAMGLLFALDSLYVSGEGPKGLGIYRLRDSNGDDQFDQVQLLKAVPGAKGEHGAHAILLGPDQKLYFIHGNSTGLPQALSPNSPFRNYAEDDLLPRLKDPVATFFDTLEKPYGYVLRTDPEGKEWQLVCGGLRNTYDFDFNADGELIAFDSDMEWDVGLPWYRPTRILHLVSGGEYGFREGSSKWPTYFPDSLPSVVDIGLSSPTGVRFGTKSSFPERYQKALFALDWSYGRILAIHMQPDGASYNGSVESFVSGKPLPVTDLEFGKDGALYFTIGGRGTQAGLYRISYTGPKIPSSVTAAGSRRNEEGEKARALRRQLESFHGTENSEAIEFAWPYLGSEDRWIRYAARVAIESQPPALWADRAISETRTNTALGALLALARCGGKDYQPGLLKALAKFPLDALNEEQQLAKYRVITLSFVRQGRPQPHLVNMAIEKLDRQYPAKTAKLNRELSSLLVYLEAPSVIEKTLALMQSATTQEEQIHYAFVLRSLKMGWTAAQRGQYFTWFNRALAEYKGGNSFTKFIETIRKEAIASLNDDERARLAPLLESKPKSEILAAPPHEFVREWSMTELTPDLGLVSKGRSFEKGKQFFKDAQCLSCHRFGNEGGSVGPDITAAASRFSRRDLLEAILEPSKIVSDQYLSTSITKHDTSEVAGLIIEESDSKVVLLNPLNQQRVEILKADISERASSKLSPMPEGLVNILKKEDILDLLAFIESGGNPSHPCFTK